MISLPSGLSELRDRYDALLCDVWGVIHNGRESFPAALDALVRWKAERGPVVLISNAPRPAVAIHAQLEHFRVPREAWTAFVTSGDATRALLAHRHGQLGRLADAEVFKKQSLHALSPSFAFHHTRSDMA